MPPRKSNVSAAGSNGAEGSPEATPAKAAKDGMSVEDLSLPKSMIARLAKGVLPANTQIHKDALLALHKSATVFVSYIASNSNENAQAGGKKTISPQDVMAALKDCEFEDFLPRLEAELKKYNETQCDKRNTYRRKVKEEKAAAVEKDEGDEDPKEGELATVPNGITNGHSEGDEEDRPVKKFKADDGSAVVPYSDDMEDDEMDALQEGETGEVDDQLDDDDGNEGEDDEDDVDEDDEDEDGHPDGPIVIRDPEYHAGTGDLRDEALDDPESDSE